MLTGRQLQIFRAIINHFTWTSQPVGSKSLLERSELPYSSATIRNEMSILEEHGFIQKTHSSSGRIPSEKGYRFYVDHLIKPLEISREEQKMIHHVFSEQYYEVEQLIQNSASILSELTNFTSILLGPAAKSNRLSGFRFVPITKKQATLVLVTDQGHVNNHLINLPEGTTLSDMERMVNILNERLLGTSLDKLKQKIPIEVEYLLKKHVNNFEVLSNVLSNAFMQASQEKVYVGGKTNIFNHPEFHDVYKLRNFLRLMEEEKGIYELFSNIPDGLQVRIGRELNNKLFDNISIVTASYKMAGEHVGRIILLGPTRMEYWRMLSLVDAVSQDLTAILTKFYHDNQT